MQAYVPGEQTVGVETVKLNTNENPYPPPPAVVRAIQDAATGPLNRYPDPMADRFREAAAETLGLPDRNWILAGNGSDEILTLLVRAFVGENQTLRLPTPSYILYRTLADIQDARWDQVAFDDQWQLDDDYAAGGDDLRLVMLPNPNSPSGTAVAPSRVSGMVHRGRCPFLVDEAYADFADANCIPLVGEQERCVVSRTLSKSYGLAGIRFGFLVAQPSIIQEIAKIKDSYNCDTISIAAATAAMQSQVWFAETIQRLKQTRTTMQQQLAELGFDVTPSQANFVWCRHPSGLHRQIYESLKRQNILIRYMSYPDFGDGLRISVGTDEQWQHCRNALEQTLAQTV